MWDNNVRSDGRTNNHSIISLEGRYHKIEDYNNALTEENKHLKLKLKDVTNISSTSKKTSKIIKSYSISMI
jgi:multidrug efflux pump subunit AcrB